MRLNSFLLLAAVTSTSLSSSLAGKIYHGTGLTDNHTEMPLMLNIPAYQEDKEEHMFDPQTFCKLLQIHPVNCSCTKTEAVCQTRIFTSLRGQNDSSVTIFSRYKGVTVVYTTIATSSSIFGMIGNAAVIMIAYKHRSNLSPTKLHVAELAAVNFIFSFVQIINVAPLYWTSEWLYGPVMCKLTKSLLEVGSLLSSGFFQLITIERYILIVLNTNACIANSYFQRFKHSLLLGNILLVTLTVIPFTYGVGIEQQSDRCINFSGDSRQMALPYTLVTFVLYSLIPICVATVLAIKLSLYFSKEKDGNLSLVSRKNLNKKIMINMMSVLILFIICTLPSRLVFITLNMVHFKSHNVLLGFQFLSYMLYSLQGTLNPILYNMMAKEWRNHFSTIVKEVMWKKNQDSLVQPLYL